MFNLYFDGWDVRPKFKTEYITLWPTCLGKDNYHMFDEVTEEEWSRFNSLMKFVSKDYKIGLADCGAGEVTFPKEVEATFSNYKDSMNKDASLFSQYILPELECVISEDWDYTYILWHKDNGAVQALIPYISKANLKHFSVERS